MFEEVGKSWRLSFAHQPRRVTIAVIIHQYELVLQLGDYGTLGRGMVTEVRMSSVLLFLRSEVLSAPLRPSVGCPVACKGR